MKKKPMKKEKMSKEMPMKGKKSEMMKKKGCK
jgi:hypothetical protein